MYDPDIESANPFAYKSNKQEKWMNSMADVAQTNLAAFDIIDFDNYQDGGTSGKSYAPPVEGQYVGKVPAIKDDGTDVISATNDFGRTQEGYLKFRLDPVELVGVDYTIKYQNAFSSKKYKNREGSQVFDFLRACGIAARPKNETELRQALKMASGRTFKFALIWEAYNKDTQETTSGMNNFPVDPNDPSKHLPYIKDEFDSSKRWFANGKIRYFVSALSKGNN